jgi:hypothetical protein
MSVIPGADVKKTVQGTEQAVSGRVMLVGKEAFYPEEKCESRS